MTLPYGALAYGKWINGIPLTDDDMFPIYAVSALAVVLVVYWGQYWISRYFGIEELPRNDMPKLIPNEEKPKQESRRYDCNVNSTPDSCDKE